MSNVTYWPSYQKKIVKRSVQCHIFVQSPPGRRPKYKYPVNISHRSDLCKNVPLQCYLVSTVIHTQFLRSQSCICVCVYVCIHTHTHTHTFFTIEGLCSGKINKRNWDISECRVLFLAYVP